MNGDHPQSTKAHPPVPPTLSLVQPAPEPAAGGAGLPAGEPARDPLLEGLNDEQREAVTYGDGPLLILAGAGSGKTRVITHRIAHLVQRRGVAPWRILAVTFTNKAAGEMRERLEKLLGPQAADVHVSTFHATGATILRREAEKVGRTRSFVIYDDGDQLQLIRRALADTGIGDRIKAQLVRHRIDQAKNHCQGPDEIPGPNHDFVLQGVRKVYRRYEQLMAAADAVDFGDLLVKVVRLFREDRETLERYRGRFRYVLVDEFQDTNPAQFELLRLLCPKNQANLCVVGDDDQSIYRWRGADISNILSFERDFPGSGVVKLERNYRSDSGILEAAYAVISKNARRKEKRLWTDRPRGASFDLVYAPDERSEAQQIATWTRQMAAEGVPLSQVAVFYRVNAQSRVLEEGMRLAGVPYHVVRGRAFYDRAEIKDAASYLRLSVNPRSDADLERVINTPARGIGDTTVERLRNHAQERNLSLFEALFEASQIAGLNAGAQRRLLAFGDLVKRLGAEVSTQSEAGSAVAKALELSGLVDALNAEATEEAGERVENLREFVGAAREFDRLHAEETGAGEGAPANVDEGAPLQVPQSRLQAFLEQISLLGDADAEDDSGRVSLMTIHAAKGLEFDAVAVTGMEENVFPHARASEGMVEPEEMAEERRLCYVAITRARRRLVFSLARTRALFGDLKQNAPSRFLADVPKELFAFAQAAPSPVRARSERPPAGEYYEREEPELNLEDGDGFVQDDFDQRPEYERAPKRRAPPPPPAPRRAAGPALQEGMRVRHETFGEGMVMSNPSAGLKPTVTVRFISAGEKRIDARFLKVVD